MMLGLRLSCVMFARHVSSLELAIEALVRCFNDGERGQVLVAESNLAFTHALHGSVEQPVRRRLEQRQVVGLPHREVR